MLITVLLVSEVLGNLISGSQLDLKECPVNNLTFARVAYKMKEYLGKFANIGPSFFFLGTILILNYKQQRSQCSAWHHFEVSYQTSNHLMQNLIRTRNFLPNKSFTFISSVMYISLCCMVEAQKSNVYPATCINVATFRARLSESHFFWEILYIPRYIWLLLHSWGWGWQCVSSHLHECGNI